MERGPLFLEAPETCVNGQSETFVWNKRQQLSFFPASPLPLDVGKSACQMTLHENFSLVIKVKLE